MRVPGLGTLANHNQVSAITELTQAEMNFFPSSVFFGKKYKMHHGLICSLLTSSTVFILGPYNSYSYIQSLLLFKFLFCPNHVPNFTYQQCSCQCTITSTSPDLATVDCKAVAGGAWATYGWAQSGKNRLRDGTTSNTLLQSEKVSVWYLIEGREALQLENHWEENPNSKETPRTSPHRTLGDLMLRLIILNNVMLCFITILSQAV